MTQHWNEGPRGLSRGTGIGDLIVPLVIGGWTSSSVVMLFKIWCVAQVVKIVVAVEIWSLLISPGHDGMYCHRM